MTSAALQPRVLIGGLGYRWMGDASFGLIASDALARENWPDHVSFADVGYGALYAALDLAAAKPPYDRVILLAATRRNREPGRVYRQRWVAPEITHTELQARIRAAGAGVIDIDHLLLIAQHFRGLPAEVICIELEPCDVLCGDRLSAAASTCVAEALQLARAEALKPRNES